MLVAKVVREASSELKEQLLTISSDRNDPAKIDTQRLGTWCRTVEDRVIGNFRLSRAGTAHRAATWRVSEVSEVSSKPIGPNGPTHTDSGFDPAESACASGSHNPEETNSPDSPNSLRSHDEQDGKTARERFEI